jgi:hypothetical protein
MAMTIDDLLALVEELCTVEQVQGLLRSARERAGKGEKREVRITGQDKGAVIHGNLREALDKRRVDLAVFAKHVVHPERSGKNGVSTQPFNSEEAPDEAPS